MSKGAALVTGGAGFIGSHLVDRLVRDGFRVSVVDNLSTGRRDHVNPESSFHCIDLNGPGLDAVFQETKPRYVFHLAAQTSVERSMRDPIADARVNIEGTIRLLQACQRAGVERLVFASTGGALYGETDGLRCSETHPIQPLSPYGVSKYAAELEVLAAGVVAGLDYTVLRYANVYGPRQAADGEGGVVAIFADAMCKGAPVTIYGDGSQERDFVYVDDVVEANLKALAHAGNDVFNVGTGTRTSVNALFRQLADLTGYRDEPRHEAPRPGEIYRSRLDIAKAGEGLGWVPSVDLGAGLTKTVAYFCRRRGEWLK